MTFNKTVFLRHKFKRLIFLAFIIYIHTTLSFAQTCCNISGWTHKMQLTIDNTGNPDTLSDYQVLFIIDTQNPISLGRMNADGSDIRFKDEFCNDLFYWIESDINTDTTKIWVKLLSVLPNSSTVISLFFGNPGALAMSNGDQTFIFFDGFDSTTVDLSKWNIHGTPTITFNAGYISILSNVNTNVEGLYTTKILDNVILEAEIKGTFQSGVMAGGGQIFGFSDAPANGSTGYLSWRNYFFYYPPDGDFIHRFYQNPGSPNQLNFPFNGMSKWSRHKMTWTPVYADASIDGAKQAITLTYNPGYAVIYDYHTEEIHCDYVFARAYANPEPSVTYGGQTLAGNLLPTSIITTDILCNGDSTGSIEISDSSTTPLIFSWNPNVSNDSLASGLSAGLYIVTISDTSSGCYSVDSIVLAEPAILNLILIATDITCKWGSDGRVDATVSGGVGPYGYSWAPLSEFTSSIDSLTEGYYTVLVSDSNGCLVSDSAMIIEPLQIVMNEIITHVSCNGGNDGAIILNPINASPPFTYIWSPNVSTDSIATGLSAGQYDISLTDSNGCYLLDTIFLLELSSGPITSMISGNNGVNPFSSHSYYIQNTTGSTYSWLVIGGSQTFGGSSDSIQVLWDSLGTGQVMVIETDSLGCIGDTVYLSVNISLAPGIDTYNLNSFGVYPNPVKGILTVELELGKEKDIVISLVTMEGKLVHTYIKTRVSGQFIEKLDLQSYPKGIYQLQLSIDGELISKKIILQ